MRIEPDEYSLVMNSVPMTPDGELGEEDAAQTRLYRVERRAAHAGSPCSSVRARALVTRMPRPIVRTNVMTTPMIDERTVRNLIHSERIDREQRDVIRLTWHPR